MLRDLACRQAEDLDTVGADLVLESRVLPQSPCWGLALSRPTVARILALCDPNQESLLHTALRNLQRPHILQWLVRDLGMDLAYENAIAIRQIWKLECEASARAIAPYVPRSFWSGCECHLALCECIRNGRARAVFVSLESLSVDLLVESGLAWNVTQWIAEADAPQRHRYAELSRWLGLFADAVGQCRDRFRGEHLWSRQWYTVGKFAWTRTTVRQACLELIKLATARVVSGSMAENAADQLLFGVLETREVPKLADALARLEPLLPSNRFPQWVDTALQAFPFCDKRGLRALLLGRARMPLSHIRQKRPRPVVLVGEQTASALE